MENNKPTVLNQGMKFGLILGLTNVAIYLLLYMIDKNLLVSTWVGLTIFAISIVLMVWPVRNYKKLNGGMITFKDAFMVCLITIVGSLLISNIFNYILYNIIDPSLSDFIKQQTIEKTAAFMEKFGTPQEEIDKALARMEEQDMSQSPSRIGTQFLWGLVFGCIPALIIAAILRTKTKPVDDIIE